MKKAKKGGKGGDVKLLSAACKSMKLLRGLNIDNCGPIEEIQYETGTDRGKLISYQHNDKQYRQEMPFSKGSINGTYRSFDNHGNLDMEVPYKNGKREGMFRWYMPDGGIALEVMFRNGLKEGFERKYYCIRAEERKIGQKCVYKDLQVETCYVHGEKNGVSRSYDFDGRLKHEIHYKNGKKNGFAKDYFGKTDEESWNLESEAFYVNDKIEGALKKYNEKGDRVYEAIYKYGKKNGLERYYNKESKEFVERKWKNDKLVE